MLATWTDPERLRWGERTNALEASGLAWNEAEWKAFQELTDRPTEEAAAC